MTDLLKVDIETHVNAGKIKKLNGGNLGPCMHENYYPYGNIFEEFKDLNLPLTRLHDAPWDNPAMRLVDVPMVFPLFHADADDPRNYYFAQTDDYIKNCLDAGTQVMYRLGVTIEHSAKRYFVNPPENTDKWIKICTNIIRHMNEGWGNGNYFNIKYWEIWNEPCNWNCDEAGNRTLPRMWGGTPEEFYDFYCEVAIKLKKRFPHLAIGGISQGRGNDDPNGITVAFLKKCQAAGAPLDFYSWHDYSASVEQYKEQVFAVRRALNQYGYPKAEMHLNEWHYHPWNGKTAPDKRRDYHSEFFGKTNKGIDSAAFICAVQSVWQDTPLDMGGYYTVTLGYYGLFDQYYRPTKSYYGMKAFGQIVKFPERFETKCAPPLYALGGGDSQGNMALLVSCFKSGAGEIELAFDVVPKELTLLQLDDERNLAPAAFKQNGSKVKVDIFGESSVLFFKFKV